MRAVVRGRGLLWHWWSAFVGGGGGGCIRLSNQSKKLVSQKKKNSPGAQTTTVFHLLGPSPFVSSSRCGDRSLSRCGGRGGGSRTSGVCK